MGVTIKLIFLAATIGSAYFIYKGIIQPHPVPIVENEYWGSSTDQGKKEDLSIRPFKIDIDNLTISDLQARLRREVESNRFTPPLESVAFEYGFNSKFLRVIGDYWLNKYDWRAREKLLNKYPHFKTKIGGLDIHFQHVKPKSKNGVAPRPLLVLHGWPGSIVEFQKIIPLLSEPKGHKYNYELVIPSLPGFGFSSAAARPGMSSCEIANIFKQLMNRLGHKKIFVMGGDWGGMIIRDFATIYPENIIAAQSNMCVTMTAIGHIRYLMASLFPGIFMPNESGKGVLPFGQYVKLMFAETGYFHIQATKPDTVGAALMHTPLGLAAYILEKFSTWTEKSGLHQQDGGFVEHYTMDALLDNIMVYWVTGSITSSMRLYAEHMNPAKRHKVDRVPTNVPFSCQYLQREVTIFPEYALKDKFTNIQKYAIEPVGGHFGAFQLPSLVADNALSHFENY